MNLVERRIDTASVTAVRQRVKPYSLALVMPLYNEEGCAFDVVMSWANMLSRLNIDYLMIVLDDGSTDRTADILNQLADHDRIEIVRKQNTGHGPTIMLGYRRAVEVADWVFQCDGDNEMPPDHFSAMWNKREDFDALFGHREGRKQNLARCLMTRGSRMIVRMIFSKGVKDVNTPYRLMRSSILRPIVEPIPIDTFAPNVVISGAIAKAKLRIHSCPVPHEPRQTGAVSLAKRKLWKIAVRTVCETVQCRILLTEELRRLRRRGSVIPSNPART